MRFDKSEVLSANHSAMAIMMTVKPTLIFHGCICESPV